jgi:alkyldihydroxyacetonephosphate synthase
MTEIGDVLARELGADRVFEDTAALAAHRTDYWVLAQLRARQGRLGDGPACVVRPRTTAEVQAVVRAAQRSRVPLVPYGAGSGVVGGATPPAGALVVDLRDMAALLELNERALYVRVQAGMMGGAYEAALQARGYTGGHFPQSVDRSTVGGWVATRAAGQFSTRYGNIEDLCLALEAVLPSGEALRLPLVPRAAAGPSLREIFLGSEGTLGIVTEVALRIHPAPEERALASFAFPSMSAALECIRRVLRAGWRPAVLRAYDQLETGRHFNQWVADRCLLVTLSEGPPALVQAEAAACAREAAASGGEAVGAEPVRHWLESRNKVPSWDFFLEREMLADTIEVAATWDRIDRIYETVVAALAEAPGVAMASGHSSHGYAQGTNIYFTFVQKPADWARAETDYLAAWGAAMRATLDAGGTISHHHGIGRLRVPWLQEELGSAWPLLRDLKRTLDPAGIMNPGVLLP